MICCFARARIRRRRRARHRRCRQRWRRVRRRRRARRGAQPALLHVHLVSRCAVCAHLDVILYAHEYENWNWCQNDGREICSFETRLRAPRKIANNHASRYTPPAVSDREREAAHGARCTRASCRTPTTNATHAAVRAACGDAHTTPALCTARALRARCARQIYMRFLHLALRQRLSKVDFCMGN